MKLNSYLLKLLGIVLFMTSSLALSKESLNLNVTHDLWISGGTVIDGSGKNGQKNDLLIKDGMIVYVGKILSSQKIKYKEKIDAANKVIAPGFIDAHAHFESDLDKNAAENHDDLGFKNFLAMGVTTVVSGQDGETSSGKEHLSVWVKKVEERKPALNIALFAGHGSIRDKAGVGLNPVPTADQLKTMETTLQQNFNDGVFGMSLGLEYEPAKFSEKAELEALAKVVGKNKGVITAHIRNEDDDVLEKSIKELTDLGVYANVQVSHLKSVYGKGTKRAKDILSYIQKVRSKTKHSVTVDAYPYSASATTIDILFPDWVTSENFEDMKKTRKTEMLTYIKNKVMKRNGPEATLFSSVKNFPEFKGKTLKDLADHLKIPFEEVIIDRIGFSGAEAVYFVMDQDLQDILIADKHVMICSDGSPTSSHPRSFGTFAKIIRYYVNEKKLLSLPEAIRKMTSFPATTYKITKRGFIKKDFFADLAIFDPAKVKDEATFFAPQTLASGFDYVIVNGDIAFHDGTFLSRHGKILKRTF